MQTQKQQTRTDIVQPATFFLGEELFGVDTLRVQEILTYQEITCPVGRSIMSED